MSDWIEINKDEKHVSKERKEAAKLRTSNWWKNEINNGICYYCKEKFPSKELTMDHIVPLSRGGKSTKGNIVPCCKNCNSKKKYYTPVELLFDQMEKDGEI